MSDTTAFADLSAELAGTVEHFAPHVVEVQSHHMLATGFFWRADLVVTPDETLAEDGTIQIELSDGAVLDAALVGRDPATDIALLRVAGSQGRPISFGVQAVRTGSLALIVAAADSAPLAAFGTIAATGPAWQSMRGGTIDARIELDLRLRRRAEGGLAIGGDGTAFGMAVRGPRGRTLVIPAATIDRVAAQLAEHGRVPIAYLGAGLRDVPVDDGSGAMVMTLDRDGPAARAAIHQGDVLLSWNGVRMRHVGMLLSTLRAAPVGSAVTLGISRGGARMDLVVTIGDRPER
jgi:S1-C subfamily serine protease